MVIRHRRLDTNDDRGHNRLLCSRQSHVRKRAKSCRSRILLRLQGCRFAPCAAGSQRGTPVSGLVCVEKCDAGTREAPTSCMRVTGSDTVRAKVQRRRKEQREQHPIAPRLVRSARRLDTRRAAQSSTAQSGEEARTQQAPVISVHCPVPSEIPRRTRQRRAILGCVLIRYTRQPQRTPSENTQGLTTATCDRRPLRCVRHLPGRIGREEATGYKLQRSAVRRCERQKRC